MTSRKKDKTYSFDFNLLETSQSLNKFQVEVRQKLIQSTLSNQILRIDLQELIQKYLTKRERQVIQLFLMGYQQQEIAQKMKISQPRVYTLLKQVKDKLKKFFIEGL